MKIKNKIHIFTAIICFTSLLYFFFFQSVKIDAIYQGEDYIKIINDKCRSTIILVSNAPITEKGRLDLWKREKENIMNRIPLQKKCDTIYFVKNKPEPPVFSENTKYWQADEQLCFKGKSNGTCISNKNIFMSISLLSLTTDGVYRDFYKDKIIYVLYQ
ncbi:DUF943 family protein [Atlantibacter sp.]|uniref:DUF943 family protein n=1 Tax=Atlantibacter sp. TaxID=1903473 RepID=UPI0028ACA77F|nr:DUF943 family protein [Atlantibacter sp.]